MATVVNALRGQLLDRRSRLERALQQSAPADRFSQLLDEVDEALERIDDGSFGICDICNEPVESDRLMADPLVRICLDHFTAEQRRVLESDLETAAQIQKGLLPEREIRSGGWHVSYAYEPATLVSGDYCDVVETCKGDLYFMLGDVSGKGVAASMLMAHLHAMFRTLIPLEMPLKQMMERASRIFCESTLPMHYATLICGRASRMGAVELCNAGHLPPVVTRAGVVSIIDGAGLPLGLFGGEEFTVSELCLEPGQRLVLYTDGYSEALSRTGDEYGRDRLMQVIRTRDSFNAHQLIRDCQADVAKFRASGPMNDDMSMLVLERE
jgi:sigma-B regulation protein RsbU (phosphoserine phosphatase)